MAENRVTGLVVEVLGAGVATARTTGLVVEVLADVNEAGIKLASSLIDDSVVTVAIDTTIPETDLVAMLLDGVIINVDVTLPDPIDVGASLSDASIVNARLTQLYPMNIDALLSDASSINVTLTYNAFIGATLVDDTKLTASLRVYTPIHLSASLADASTMNAALLHLPATGVGPFYFAWAAEDETPFNASLLRDDEDIFSFTLTQQEGDFAHLSIVVKNPRIGLLAPSRKVWCWLSFYNGVVAKPLFFGRLVGLPSNIFDTRVTLEFIARPADFMTQKISLAETLRVAPYFDPLFVSPDSWEDPDVVLEARTEMWHVDRVSHVLTTSDVVTPEDGVIELTEDDHLYTGLATSLSTAPLRRVQVIAQIPWTQTAFGNISLTRRVLAAWPNIKDASAKNFASQLVGSYTFEGLSGDWPKPGAKFGQGWTVSVGSLVDLSGLIVPLTQIPGWQLEAAGVHGSATTVETENSTPKVPLGSVIFVQGWQYTNVGYSGVDLTYIPIGWGVPELEVSYDSSRNYSETVVIDLEADMQSIVTLPGDDEILILNVNANSASDVSRDGSVPLYDPKLNSFAMTPRGLLAVQHLTLLARANLINRARAVNISCTFADFLHGFDITLRKGLLIHDHRLPGGQATGKITAYSLSYANGKPIATATINSTVGYGGALTTNEGVDAYIDDDYITDYYVRDGNVVLLPSSDVTYTVPHYSVNDDGINFMRGLNDGYVLQSIHVTGGPVVQRAALNEYAGPVSSLDDIGNVLQGLPTEVHVNIKPIGKGPYSTLVPVAVSNLVIPKQIDLEATS